MTTVGSAELSVAFEDGSATKVESEVGSTASGTQFFGDERTKSGP